MNSTGRLCSWYRSFTFLAIGWILLALFLMLQVLPDLPQSKLMWVLLVLFAPPLYVLVEAFLGWLFSERHGHSFSSSGFSFKRILFALPVAIAFFALSWWASWFLTRGAV